MEEIVTVIIKDSVDPLNPYPVTHINAVQETEAWIVEKIDKYSETLTHIFVKEHDRELWFFRNALHRVGSPAVVFYNGDEEWYFEGELHRVDGPAVEYVNGRQEWYQYGTVTRDDGPAIVSETPKNSNEPIWVDWFIDGRPMVKREYREAVFKSATQVLQEENLAGYPFTEIESMLFSFQNWKNNIFYDR
jgi:hypothetical protein